jgi:hypothetical protein
MTRHASCDERVRGDARDETRSRARAGMEKFCGEMSALGPELTVAGR